MIRRFIQCKNTKERLDLMASSKEQEWTEGELDTVIEIFGLKIPEDASKKEKWAWILLSLTNKEAADAASLKEKIFSDAKNEKIYYTEDMKTLSDLKAYLKVCELDENASYKLN